MENCSSADELKKAYRKLALRHHPDKGGDPEEFKRITKEYEERLANFEGGLTEETYHVEISLVEAYTGVTKKFVVTNQHRCRGCSVTCQMCHGKGTLEIELGPFRMAHHCGMCGGSGGSPPRGCSACNHSGMVKTSKEYTVVVPPGCPDQLRSGPFIVKVRSDPNFERVGTDNLLIRPKIPFAQTIHGCMFTVQHLTRKIVLDTTEWAPLDPRRVYIFKGNGFTPNGNLHVQFDIQYPTPAQKSAE